MMRFLSNLFRVLLAFVFALALLAGLAFVGLMVLKPQIDRELQGLIHKTQGRNIEIYFLDYGKVRLSRLGIAFGPIRARGATRIKHPYFESREFDLSIQSAQFNLQNFTGKSFKIIADISKMDVKGGRIFNEDKEDRERLESVTGIDFKFDFPLEGLPHLWKAQLLKRAKEFKAWAFDNQPIRSLESKGTAVFIVDDWPISVRFHSLTNSEGFVHLEGNAEDLRVIAEMIEPKFTDSDLNLAAKNLLKTPRLLSIRTEAEAQAMRLKGRDPQIAYDVPRHIYWGYYLAKAYGSEFAYEATNAHEVGDALNSTAESAKDRHHNALGIEYAERHLSEIEIEKLIFEDPRVFRIQTKASKKAPTDNAPAKAATAPISSVL